MGQAFPAAHSSRQSLRAAETEDPDQHDVVILAKAGFTEEFIIGTIGAQKSDFDISAPGLADLAYESTFLFGFFHRKIGVGAAPHPDKIIAPQFGTNLTPARSRTPPQSASVRGNFRGAE